MTLKKLVDQSTVNIINEEMLLHVDEEPCTLDRALSAFEDTLDQSENGIALRCSKSIKNSAQFGLVVDYLSVDTSFRIAPKIVPMIKVGTELDLTGSCSAVFVPKYARFSCALNVQQLENVLAMAWRLSAAMDVFTHIFTSSLSVRTSLQCGKYCPFVRRSNVRASYWRSDVRNCF